MIYLESFSTNPYYNLALEEYVFQELGQKNDCFLLWQNENTVVVGKYQNTAEEINPEYISQHSTRVVRRLSGGGAVYHDLGNLNFTFVVGADSDPNLNFEIFTLPVLETLKRLGVNAEFNGRNDLTIDGLKFSGNSQYSKNGRILHHGCIMLESNLETVSDVLRVKPAKFQSKSAKSVRSRVTTVNAHAPAHISILQFKSELLKSIQTHYQIEPRNLSRADILKIEQLQKAKYETWEWNYGKSPKFNMSREMKFPAGLVTVHMDVDCGHIQNIKIFGDFFCDGELEELERKIVGLKIDNSLEDALAKLNIGTYIRGFSAKELALLIR